MRVVRRPRRRLPGWASRQNQYSRDYGIFQDFANSSQSASAHFEIRLGVILGCGETRWLGESEILKTPLIQIPAKVRRRANLIPHSSLFSLIIPIPAKARRAGESHSSFLSLLS